MADFLGLERLSLGPWPAFERALQRRFIHAGFDDVRLVGGSGDLGADIVAEREGKTWVIQAKHRSTGQLVGPEAIDEVCSAATRYGATRAVVATNSGFSGQAVDRAKKLKGEIGVGIGLWPHERLLADSRALPLYAEMQQEAREYQAAAIQAVNERIAQGGRRGLVYMATGLGKTRIAAGVVETWICDRPGSDVLVLVPTLELVFQFEAALWPFLPKTIATHVLTGSEKPAFNDGVTVATYQSAARRDDFRGRFGLVVVDEAHHAPADGFSKLISELAPQFLLGLTATPWRGDERLLADVFGEPTASMSIVEGMQQGYLAQVDYRMLVDDVDWDYVQAQVGEAASIAELNRKLFVPERDEAAVAKIVAHLDQMDRPRCIVFCRSVEHAERVALMVRAMGRAVRAVHSRLDRVEVTRALREFRAGVVPMLVAVDMLNEGVDVPDVNLLVFLRVTHSRRIFVQQLGRGLRIREGKAVVRVLDFVTDIRRIAAAHALNREATAIAGRPDGARVVYPTGQIVSFEGDARLDFVIEYLADVAGLEDVEDGATLRFPEWPGGAHA